jgi:hypothetical protein
MNFETRTLTCADLRPRLHREIDNFRNAAEEETSLQW